MELEDCALPLLKGWALRFDLDHLAIFCLLGIQASSEPLEAFKDADVIALVGSLPRKEGMQRKDLLHANAGIFKVQGSAINDVAKPTVKVITGYLVSPI